MNIADLIGDRLRALPGPRSLVELGIGHDEERALRTWAQAVTYADLRRQPRAFGLSFLACATSAAREDAGENTVWPHVRRWFSAGANALWPGGQPSNELRDALEEAARFFDLRHALDRDASEHRWYVTVLLQCGLTRPALQRLPEWLAGQRPWRAVELLLHDSALAADSFVAVFERLRGVRLGWYDDLPASSWLGRDMSRLACEAARTRLSLGTSAASQSSGAGVQLESVAGGGLAFRVPVRLPESIIGRGPPHIDVEIGGQRGPRAHRQNDGSYSGMPDSVVGLADVPATGSVMIRLLDPESLLLHEEDLTLFAGDEDIDVFAAAGGHRYRRTADPWVDLAPARGAMLRVADDLPLKGKFLAPAILGARSRWQRVEHHEMGAVEVPLGEDLAWTFLLHRSKQWAGSIEPRVDSRSWSIGSAIAWTLRLAPRAARVRAARLGRERLRVETGPDGTLRIVTEPRQSMPLSFSLRLHIEDGGHQYMASCKAPSPAAPYLFGRADEGWRVLHVKDLAGLTRPTRWFGGPSETGDTPWLFEGGRPVLPLGDRDVVLGPRLAGYGARLSVEGRRFNPDVPPIDICSTLDGATCLGTLESSGPRTLVRFSPGFAWRESFDLTVLSEDGAPRNLTSDEYTVTPDLLVLRGAVPSAAVAVACRGELVAAAFSGRLHRVIDAAGDVRECARWLFAAHAPVVFGSVRDALVQAVGRQPFPAIALTFDPRRPTGNNSAAPSPHWDEFLMGFWRECLEQAIPAIEAACAAESAVADLLLDPALNPFAAKDVPGNSVALAISRLAYADPVLAARVLAAANRSSDKALSRTLIGARNELRETIKAPSLDDIAGVLGVDEHFVSLNRQAAVEWALGRALPGDRHENIRRLMYLPEFRRAVAADAIERLTWKEPHAGRRPGHR